MSHNRDETHPERTAFASLIVEAEGSEEGLDAEKIWKAVSGDLSPQETGRLLEQAGESAEFAEAWRLARELQAAAADHSRGESDVRFGRRLGPTAIWVGIAASLVLAIGFWPGLWEHSAPPPPVYRATGSQNLVSQIEEGIALPRERFLLRWSPAEGAGWSYEVRLATEQLEELALARDLGNTEFLVPSEALEASESGSRLYWRVEAENEDGRKRSSPTFIVHLQ